MIKKIFLLFIVLFISYNSFSQDWVLMTTSNSGLNFYCNSKRIKKENGIIDSWEKTSHSDNIKLKIYRQKFIQNRVKLKLSIKGYNDYSYRIEHVKYDCNAKTRCILSSIQYNSKGEVLSEWESPNEKWYDIIPDSVGDEILNIVCVLNFNK